MPWVYNDTGAPVTDPDAISHLNLQLQARPQEGVGSVFPSGIDTSKQGDEFLNQFSPELRDAAIDYHAGLRMPTGNPRRQSYIREIASKYGRNIGMPSDETTFAARRTLRNQLASGSPASMGGQLRN